MTGVAALAEALARGGRVVWDAPRPRLLVPPALRDRVLADRETVRKLLGRAALFREQARRFIHEGRPLPILALPEYGGEIRGGCISCGDPAGPGPFRCAVCALAVRLALEGCL